MAPELIPVVVLEGGVVTEVIGEVHVVDVGEDAELDCNCAVYPQPHQHRIEPGDKSE